MRITGVILVCIMILGYIVIEQSRQTTYQELMSNLISEDETIEEITVSQSLLLMKKTATVTLDNLELISNILGAEIKLKKIVGNKPIMSDHTLFIKTDKNSYQVHFNEGRIAIGSEEYYTIDPYLNPIFSLIQNEDLDWVIK